MNEIKLFEKEGFGQVRTVKIDGEAYFYSTDVAKSLGYANPHDAVIKHCRWVAKCEVPHPQSQTKTLEVNVIPQGDIIRLAANSELPTAKKFESWIFDEVIPSVMNHGIYATDNIIDRIIENPDFGIELLTKLKEERERNKRLKADNERMKPKEEFFDAVTDSKDAIDIGKVAKVLNYPGIGRNKLFEILRERGVLMKDNMPYQKYIDSGYFRTIEQKYQLPDGATRINIKTLVFQKGVDYIRKILEVA